MSDEHEYQMRIGVQMSGYDTIRYAAISVDTAMTAQVRMSGFNAMMATAVGRQPRIQVALPSGKNAVAVDDLADEIRHTLRGASLVRADRDSLRVVLTLRASKTVPIAIDHVRFAFSEQFGLYGEPRIEPAQVTLYGPQEVLAQVDELQVKDTSLADVKKSASYILPLEPVWTRYADVHPSSKEVSLYLPVEPYVERDYNVAVSVLGMDSTVQVKLYPDHVTAHVWIAQRDMDRMPEMQVGIDYDEVVQGGGKAAARLTRFPAYVRPKSIEPADIQCVVIQ